MRYRTYVFFRVNYAIHLGVRLFFRAISRTIWTSDIKQSLNHIFRRDVQRSVIFDIRRIRFAANASRVSLDRARLPAHRGYSSGKYSHRYLEIRDWKFRSRVDGSRKSAARQSRDMKIVARSRNHIEKISSQIELRRMKIASTTCQ